MHSVIGTLSATIRKILQVEILDLDNCKARNSRNGVVYITQNFEFSEHDVIQINELHVLE